MTLNPKTIALSLVTLVIVWFLAYGIKYSIEQYQLAWENITICTEKWCIKTMHIHSDIDISICGKAISLPREHGPLNGLHTHKEKNYLHFHDKVPLVSGENTLEWDKRLSIGEVFEIFAIKPEELCGRPEVEMILKVNEIVAPEGLKTMWTDGDDITIEVL